MINVLLVDDHDLVRTGIKCILDGARGIRVIGEAGTGEDALAFVEKRLPDVVLMDINMPGIGGLETTRKVLRIDSRIRIVVVTVFSHEPFPTQLLEAGAVGYLSKSCSAEEIVAAIRSARRGQPYIAADVARQLAMSALSGAERSPLHQLSQRELVVMQMLTMGHTNQDISDRLCLSPKTVSTYRYRLYDKLGVDNDVELTHIAIRHGVIEPRPRLPDFAEEAI